MKYYVVTPYLNLLIETVQLRGRNTRFCAGFRKIIHYYHLVLLLNESFEKIFFNYSIIKIFLLILKIVLYNTPQVEVVDPASSKNVLIQYSTISKPLLSQKIVFYYTLYSFYVCPRDDSQGALRFAPVCPSVCLSVRPFITLYGIEFV